MNLKAERDNFDCPVVRHAGCTYFINPATRQVMRQWLERTRDGFETPHRRAMQETRFTAAVRKAIDELVYSEGPLAGFPKPAA